MKCFLLTALVLSTTEAFQILLGPPAVSTKRASPKVSLILLRGQSTTEESPKKNRVSIEYCLGCRWDLKAFWYAQEILTTFSEDLDAVTIIPSRNTKGNFAVRFNHDEELLWDRKEKGAFPETKVLKQKIRDLVAPELHLGHSDTEERQSQDTSGDIFASEWVPRGEEDSSIQIELAKGEAPEPSVRIHYCTGCRWLLRAAYCAQELMSTFKDEINSVTLVPSKPPARGGRFVSFIFDFIELLLANISILFCLLTGPISRRLSS
jgi:selenoprotein W-related protein